MQVKMWEEIKAKWYKSLKKLRAQQAQNVHFEYKLYITYWFFLGVFLVDDISFHLNARVQIVQPHKHSWSL